MYGNPRSSFFISIPITAWSDRERNFMSTAKINQELFNFIHSSPSPYHAVATAAAMLENSGFLPLREQDPWKLETGGRYYVIRNQSSLAAFCLPRISHHCAPAFHIIASHSDSPSFKMKENGEMTVENQYTRLNVERYGGSILSPWFDRPLSLAGRVLTEDHGCLKSRLVNLDQDLAMIVNLAIHMNRNINDGYKYSIQTDMLPIIGGREPVSVKTLAASYLNVPENSILTMDLFLYNRMKGRIWGASREFIGAPRLDDLQCAFASFQAILNKVHPELIPMAVMFDNEEVGSQSRQGACSTFLKDVIRRISLSLALTEEEYLCALSRSFMVSADNGHALHPNYPGKSDPSNHPCLNGGVLIKYAANQKYTTDGLSSAIFQAICRQAQVPVQMYFNHSDVPGGSTLGNLSASQISIPSVDIGAPLLGMHSPYETGGADDTASLISAMEAFFQTRIEYQGQQGFLLSPM